MVLVGSLAPSIVQMAVGTVVTRPLVRSKVGDPWLLLPLVGAAVLGVVMLSWVGLVLPRKVVAGVVRPVDRADMSTVRKVLVDSLAGQVVPLAPDVLSGSVQFDRVTWLAALGLVVDLWQPSVA